MKKTGKITPPSVYAGTSQRPAMGRLQRKALRTIVVTHPVYGRFEAVGVRDKLQAVQAAAKEWKLQWSKIAKECAFTDAVDST